MSNQVTLTSTGALQFSQADQPGTVRQGNPGDQLTLDAAGQPSWAQGDTANITEIETDLGEITTAQAILKVAHFSGDNAALADGALAAGDFTLWLDQTNGACKLMVKAKQADGTVRAATIALA